MKKYLLITKLHSTGVWYENYIGKKLEIIDERYGLFTVRYPDITTLAASVYKGCSLTGRKLEYKIIE